VINQQLSSEQQNDIQQMLRDYLPSEKLLELCRRRLFGTIVGPAGSGKDTLRQALLTIKRDKFCLLLSDTSRARRANEQEGVEYHFRSLEEMLAGFENGQYLQGALVHGQQLSGLNGSELVRLPEGLLPLSILVIQTVEALREMQLDMRAIFLLPPSIEAMRERLAIRQGVGVEEIERRFTTAKTELALVLDRQQDYQLITTKTLEHSLSVAAPYLLAGTKNSEEQTRSLVVLEKLLSSL
jgi:guanylate kinase